MILRSEIQPAETNQMYMSVSISVPKVVHASSMCLPLSLEIQVHIL